MDPRTERTATTALARAWRATGTLTGALGLFLIAGFAAIALATWLFEELGDLVTAGRTLAVDDAVLGWMAAHQSPTAVKVAVEVTALGTGAVVIMIAAVTALFLWLLNRPAASGLLLVATAGSLVLSTVLKLHYARPRPQIFPWGVTAISSSFPSGHATNAIVVYGTLAYLAVQLAARPWIRVTIALAAALVVLAIAASRLYLGVHYPSDVVGGAIVGGAWAGFCMAVLEALRRVRFTHAARDHRLEKRAARRVT